LTDETREDKFYILYTILDNLQLKIRLDILQLSTSCMLHDVFWFCVKLRFF